MKWKDTKISSEADWIMSLSIVPGLALTRDFPYRKSNGVLMNAGPKQSTYRGDIPELEYFLTRVDEEIAQLQGMLSYPTYEDYERDELREELREKYEERDELINEIESLKQKEVMEQ